MVLCVARFQVSFGAAGCVRLISSSVEEVGWQPFGKTRPRGYKTFFMLNLAEHEIYLAHKCFKKANNCWHFNIYKQDK